MTTAVELRQRLNGDRSFRSSGEFFQAVANATTTRVLDPRLTPLAAVGSDEQSGQNDPYGGFLVPEEFSPGNLDTFAGDVLADRVTRFRMGAPITNFISRMDKNHSSGPVGGLAVYRRAETGELTSTRLEMERLRLEAHSLFGLAYASNLLTDGTTSAESGPGISALLEAGFSDAFAERIMYERLHGTGVGEYLGVLNSPCLITVAKDSGQTAGTITATNVVGMQKRCWRFRDSIWLAHPDAYEQLIQLQIESSTPAGTVKLFDPVTNTLLL